MPSTRAIQMEITRYSNAIGYGGKVSFTYRPDVKVLPVSSGNGKPAIQPTNENVTSGIYPVAQAVHRFAGTPSGPAAQFIRFCRSPQGQQLVEKIGNLVLPGAGHALQHLAVGKTSGREVTGVPARDARPRRS